MVKHKTFMNDFFFNTRHSAFCHTTEHFLCVQIEISAVIRLERLGLDSTHSKIIGEETCIRLAF